MRLYKHENNTDVAFEVIKAFYVKEKELWKFKVSWWNIVPSHKPFPFNIIQKVEISKKDWNDKWKLYEFTPKGA